MQHIDIQAFSGLYQFSTALRKRVFVFLLNLAEAQNEPELASWFARSLEHEKSVLDLEWAWRRARDKERSYDPEIVVLDRRADAILGGLDRLLASFAELHKDDKQTLAGLTGLRQLLFPDGLKAMTQQAIPEQHALVVRALEELGQDEHEEIIARFHLGPYLKQLGEVCMAMNPGIESFSLPFGRLKEARRRGQFNLFVAVSKVIARFSEAEDEEERSRFLRVIASYNERIGESLRRGKASAELLVEDVEDEDFLELDEPKAA